MDASPLKRLPAELRNRIYHLVLPYKTNVYVHDADPRNSETGIRWLRRKMETNTIALSGGKYGRVALFPRDMSQNARESIGLLLTCRQIQAEALPIFLGNNKFEVRVCIGEMRFQSLTEMIFLRYRFTQASLIGAIRRLRNRATLPRSSH